MYYLMYYCVAMKRSAILEYNLRCYCFVLRQRCIGAVGQKVSSFWKGVAKALGYDICHITKRIEEENLMICTS